MEIDNHFKFKDIPLYVKQHLSFQDTKDIKFSVAVFTFLMLDISLLPLFYQMVDLVLYLGLPFLIFIHVWAIRLLIKNPYSTQSEFILFMGFTGFLGTICYLFLSHKIAYQQIGITSVSYYLTSTAAILLIIGYLVYFQINKYSNITKVVRYEKVSNIRIIGPSVGAISGLGYIFAQATKESELIMYSMFLVFSLFFCLLFAYISAKFFHKYFFMKANPQFVGLQQPYKSKKREFEKKGVVIK